jgi:hypothetical protein
VGNSEYSHFPQRIIINYNLFAKISRLRLLILQAQSKKNMGGTKTNQSQLNKINLNQRLGYFETKFKEARMIRARAALPGQSVFYDV